MIILLGLSVYLYINSYLTDLKNNLDMISAFTDMEAYGLLIAGYI